MISRIEALRMFVSAREKQKSLHEQRVSLTEAEAADVRYRRQRAEDVLKLTAKYGGDFEKAAEEYSVAKKVESGLVSSHPTQPNSEYFTTRENALEELNMVMEGNPILKEIFNDLFEEVAITAIGRAYSNGRSFFFLSPFIDGVVLNRENINWGVGSIEELNTAIDRVIDRDIAWNKVTEKIRAYNTEAERVGGPVSYAGSIWALISTLRVWDAVQRIAILSVLGDPNSSSYCTFWRRVHAGDEGAAKILACLYRHLPGLKAEMKTYLAEYGNDCPVWAQKGLQFINAE